MVVQLPALCLWPQLPPQHPCTVVPPPEMQLPAMRLVSKASLGGGGRNSAESHRNLQGAGQWSLWWEDSIFSLSDGTQQGPMAGSRKQKNS